MVRVASAGFLKSAALAGVLAISVLPTGARSENLADALVGAYNTSGLLQQNRALMRAADEDVAIAVATLRPVVDFILRASRTLVNGLSSRPTIGITDSFAGFIAEYQFYDGGNRRLNIQAQQETVLATRQTLLSVEQSILLRAVQAYMNVVRQEEFVRLGENNVRVLGEEARAAQDRFDVGEVTRSDVALAESRLAASRSNLALERGNLVNAQEEYLVAVGKRPGKLVATPPFPSVPASVETAKSVAVRTHPDILAAQHQISAAELNVQRARTLLGPTASVSAQVGTDVFDSDTFDTGSVSLNLRQNIYQGGGTAAQIRRAMATRDAQRANLLTVQDKVTQDAATAFVGLEVARARIKATELQIEAAQIAFDGIREEATLGARTTLDVLIAERELLDALASNISAQVDRYIAAYGLLAAQGLLTAERLGLAVQIYDPAAYYNRVKNAPAAFSQQGRDLDRILQSLGKE